jgi:hypothetical protein
MRSREVLRAQAPAVKKTGDMEAVKNFLPMAPMMRRRMMPRMKRMMEFMFEDERTREKE